MMRKIYLVNEVGSTYFFDYRNSTLISSIGNLGVEKQNTYVAFENRYKCVETKNPQTSVDFGVVFLKGYKGYSDFLKFIRESNELRLFYNNGSNTKYSYVEFKSISKTELQSNVIQSSLSLDKLSLWLLKTNYQIKVNEDKNGKVFPFGYPHTYRASYNGEISIRNNGETNASLNIVISGAVNNPVVEILDGDEVVSSLKLNYQSTNCIIVVNSEESDQYIEIMENGVTINGYQKQDFSCENFLFVGKGEWKARFIPGVNAMTTCTIQVTEGYGGN